MTLKHESFVLHNSQSISRAIYTKHQSTVHSVPRVAIVLNRSMRTQVISYSTKTLIRVSNLKTGVLSSSIRLCLSGQPVSCVFKAMWCLRNVGNRQPTDAVSHRRRSQFISHTAMTSYKLTALCQLQYTTQHNTRPLCNSQPES